MEQMVSGRTMFSIANKSGNHNARLLCGAATFTCELALIMHDYSVELQACTRSTSSIRSQFAASYHQRLVCPSTSKRQAPSFFFARSMSTRWCGVHTLFRESHLSAHFDFRTHGGGGHLCGAQSMLSFRVIALATTTRR